jgi:hypothetical protein
MKYWKLLELTNDQEITVYVILIAITVLVLGWQTYELIKNIEKE